MLENGMNILELDALMQNRRYSNIVNLLEGKRKKVALSRYMEQNQNV
jgi:hypothetical protein